MLAMRFVGRLLLLSVLGGAPACAAELKVATWNLEWLTNRPAGDPLLPSDVRPKRSEDVARLAHYAAILNADVIAFQEVDGPDMAARIFPPDRYTLHLTGDHVVQRTGLAIRNGIAFTDNPDLTALDLYPADAHFRLRSGADVTLHLRTGLLRVLTVHLKTGCHEDPLATSRRSECHTLGEQLVPLQAWVASRVAEGVPFLLLGDFNRWMDGPDAFWAGLAHAAPLARATAGHSSPCWGASSSSTTSLPAEPRAGGWSRTRSASWSSAKPATNGRNVSPTTVPSRCGFASRNDSAGSDVRGASLASGPAAGTRQHCAGGKH
jgi:endonuclease/exonuclease/phosphatase family metal-dependent hydrolase